MTLNILACKILPRNLPGTQADFCKPLDSENLRSWSQPSISIHGVSSLLMSDVRRVLFRAGARTHRQKNFIDFSKMAIAYLQGSIVVSRFPPWTSHSSPFRAPLHSRWKSPPLTFAIFRYLKLPAVRHEEFKESRPHPNDRSPSCLLELLSQVQNHIETLATDPHSMRREDLTLERFISGTLLRTFILPKYLTGSISSHTLTTIRSIASLRWTPTWNTRALY